MFTVPVLIGIAIAGLIAVVIGVMAGSRGAAARTPSQSSAESHTESTHAPVHNAPLDVNELSRRIGLSADELKSLVSEYRVVEIQKPKGGKRRLEIPDDVTMKVQRRILKRLLSSMKAHTCACGFESGTSIVHAARPHNGKRVVVKLDIRRFFESTSADRIQAYFQGIGWNREAAQLLTKLTTFNGHLPQGAPTSPRLSNLVNAPLDEGLLRIAQKHKGDYSRYADDITLSFNFRSGRRARGITQAVRRILRSYGYAMHGGRKLKILRQNQRQQVLGLVVNAKTALPRKTRRWLRAVRHHMDTGKATSISAAQLQGWEALARMVDDQRD